MAEAMINENYRESIQSLDKLIDKTSQPTPYDPDHGAQTNIARDDGGPNSNVHRRVTHDPRTVVIEIPDNKRRKISNAMTTGKNVIEAIGVAISYEHRREAICTATTSFDHNMQSLHDEEIELGADAALIKHIGFVLGHKGALSTQPYELSCTCEALEMIYRASPASVSASFEKYGVDLLSILIHLVNDEIDRRRGRQENVASGAFDNIRIEQDQSRDGNARTFSSAESSPLCGSMSTTPSTSDEDGRRDGDIILRKATKIMGHFARVGAATQPMAYFPGLLLCLINILTTRPFSMVPSEVRLNALWILANLACNTENMVMMACQPNLLQSLVGVASREVLPNDSVEIGVEILRAQSIASRALVNLSWAPENRVPMSEDQALLRALGLLAIFRESPFKKGRTVADMILQSRRHSVGALRNLAAAPRRIKLQLVEFQQGALLNYLTDAALNDPDGQVKERAFGTIHNLAIHDTAERMVQNPALVLALKDAMILSESESNKTFAQKTLLVLERSITQDMGSYETLRELLDEVNYPSDNQADVECCTPMSGLSDESDNDNNLAAV